MNFKKIIVFFVLMAILLMPVSVFADTSFPDPPSDVWGYWVVIDKDGNGHFHLVCSYNPITMQSYGNKILLDGIGKIYTLDKINGRWEMANDLTTGFYGITSMHASNHDIAFDDGSGFFFLRDRGTLLFPAAMTADFGMIWKIILDGLIPLVGCLILGLSFRKGWAFLQNQLTH